MGLITLADIASATRLPTIIPLSAAVARAQGRSPRWRKVRSNYIMRFPRCAACGGLRMLNVHHIIPFHESPELELVESNLMTLCEGSNGINCHLWFGHCGNWSAWNVDAVLTAMKINRVLFGRSGVEWKPD